MAAKISTEIEVTANVSDAVSKIGTLEGSLKSGKWIDYGFLIYYPPHTTGCGQIMRFSVPA